MLAVLGRLSLSDVIGFWRLAKAAPYVLACVLFTQMGQVMQQGLAFAAKAFGALHSGKITHARSLMQDYSCKINHARSIMQDHLSVVFVRFGKKSLKNTHIVHLE